MRIAWVWLAAVLGVLPISSRAQTPVARAEVMIDSGTPGIQLYLRNKYPEGRSQFRASRTLLFVHGATYPASTSFDLPVEQVSWMDFMAKRGFDVWLLDLPGYGRSTRPPQMDQPADANPPFTNTADAVRAYKAAADYIMRTRHIDRLDVMGWSWGTTIAAGYAAQFPATVYRLVLYAPLWVPDGPVTLGGTGKLGAYRLVTRAAAEKRWLAGVPADQVADLIPPGVFDAWANATFATDPTAADRDPPSLRAPNGVIEDLRNAWGEGHPTYDPARVLAPTLIVQGEWDHDTPPAMARALFGLLSHAAWKQYTLLGEGTHTMLLERNRLRLYEAVQDFLEDDLPSPLVADVKQQ
jgi:pimeloyl-ACP methyl ester carboxylesterase